jgi:hypothetical protein
MTRRQAQSDDHVHAAHLIIGCPLLTTAHFTNTTCEMDDGDGRRMAMNLLDGSRHANNVAYVEKKGWCYPNQP